MGKGVLGVYIFRGTGIKKEKKFLLSNGQVKSKSTLSEVPSKSNNSAVWANNPAKRRLFDSVKISTQMEVVAEFLLKLFHFRYRYQRLLAIGKKYDPVPAGPFVPLNKVKVYQVAVMAPKKQPGR